MHVLLQQPKTCASLTTIREVGFVVQNPPTLISLTSLGPI